MPKIKLESIQEGMVVASDIKNLDDMLLIPAGCTLSEKHINILHAWGISEVNVEAGGDVKELADPLQRVPPEMLARMREELKARFWKFEENNAVHQELFRLLLQRRVRQLPL
jgi:hypothetical protein